jgi:glycosyltransferase involved in cell wall biosynthesis
MPKATVFIPVFNTEKFIGQAIQSIISQSFKDWELIILDDCSTDLTYKIALEYSKKDDRIKVYRNKKNLGMMANWIEGLSLCKNEYWGKLDADDYWNSNMLENSINILENNKNVALVCSKYVNINAEGNTEIDTDSPPDFAVNATFSCLNLVKLGPIKMFQYNVLRQGIGLMRRNVFDELGNFTLLDSGDTEMWFRIGCHHDIYCIDKVLHYHRIWADSFMRKNADENRFRHSKNFFDTRNAIFDYYHNQKKITLVELKHFKNETKFIFNSFLIFKNRKEGNYLKMFKHLLENMFIDIKKMLVENLHIDRLIKITSND